MAGRLHRKPGFPYYITAPDYRETSAGIQVLHYLCHALNLQGHDAWVTGCSKVNPDLKTPILTEGIRQQHQRDGRTPIAVYAEVYPGNILNTPVCVRYMLNREGALGPGSVEAGPDDLFFYFRPEFYQGAADESVNVLTLPSTDMNLFAPDDSRVRTSNYLYLHRLPAEAVNYAQLPDDIQLLSMDSPLTLQQLAHAFKGAKALYTYEAGSTCTKALLSGCPVVALRAPGHEHLAATQKTADDLGGGFAWDDSDASLERARAELPGMRAYQLGIEDIFWDQLDEFVRLTQARAAAENSRDSGSISDWLASRAPVKSHAALIDEHLQQHRQDGRLGIVIIDREGNLEPVIQTLQSLDSDTAHYDNLGVMVLTPLTLDPQHSNADLQFVTYTPGQLEQTLNARLGAFDCAWFMRVEAGVRFLPAGLQTMALELLAAPGCRAIYGDEFYRVGASDMNSAYRPGFNLDYLLSAPAHMSRHWLWNKACVQAMGGFEHECGSASELAMILRLVESEGLAGLGHVNEPILVADTPSSAADPHVEALLHRHLQARGYAQARVAALADGHYRILYNLPHHSRSTVMVLADQPLALLQRCLNSLLEVTANPDFDVVMVNVAGTSESTRAWLATLGRDYDSRVWVASHAQLPAVAALNATAATLTNDYLVMLAGNTLIEQPQWLDNLINHAVRGEVAVVGPKLVDSQGRCQSAGLILGLDDIAGPAFFNEPSDARGYLDRLLVDQNYSAVSGDCLMMRREVFNQLGGLDNALSLSAATLDLCLRSLQAGCLTVWTPFAHVTLLDSVQPLPSAAAEEAARLERRTLQQRWLPLLADDPAYNQNLRLDRGGFRPDYRFSREWRRIGQALLPRVLCQTAVSGEEQITQQVFKALQDSQRLEGVVCQPMLSALELQRFAPDSIVYSLSLTDPLRIAQIEEQAVVPALRVVDLSQSIAQALDQGLDLKGYIAAIMPQLQAVAPLVDRLVIPDAEAAEALRAVHKDVRQWHTPDLENIARHWLVA
ncbi:glycosyltransferase [Pseudomonas sp. TE3610]